MTVNEVKDFLNSGKNKELVQKIGAANTISEAYKVATEGGMKCTAQDFAAAIKDSMSGDTALSEALLKHVAGGVSGSYWSGPGEKWRDPMFNPKDSIHTI